jgi:putative phosphoribosyl transferase
MQQRQRESRALKVVSAVVLLNKDGYMINTLSGHDVIIPAGAVTLTGNLVVPRSCRAAVIFAHGSGSSMHSPRNRFVAGMLQDAGIGTLLFDLLTPEEDTIYKNRFDIDLLAERLKASTLWLRKLPEAELFTLGYFGASTGTAAALRVAAELGSLIRAVVSRGGRTDLAGPSLPQVTASVLFIVGGNDQHVLDLNREAYAKIKTDKDLAIVPGATHLFEERGALEEVARLAVAWFKLHL